MVNYSIKIIENMHNLNPYPFHMSKKAMRKTIRQMCCINKHTMLPFAYTFLRCRMQSYCIVRHAAQEAKGITNR